MIPQTIEELSGAPTGFLGDQLEKRPAWITNMQRKLQRRVETRDIFTGVRVAGWHSGGCAQRRVAGSRGALRPYLQRSPGRGNQHMVSAAACTIYMQLMRIRGLCRVHVDSNKKSSSCLRLFDSCAIAVASPAVFT